MATIAGLTDFRLLGSPADLSSYLMPTTVLVFFYAGNVVAVRSGPRGWTLIDQGPVVHTVVASAFADLTPDRTWKEKVTLMGALPNLIGDIEFPADYIILQVLTKLQMASGINENALHADGKAHIDILFGEYVANDDAYADSQFLQNGIYFVDCEDVALYRPMFRGWQAHDIHFDGLLEGSFYHPRCVDSLHDGIHLGASGLRGCEDVDLFNPIAKDNTENGLQFGADSINCAAFGGKAEGSGINGIVVGGTDNKLFGTKALDNLTRGVYIQNSIRARLTDVTALGNPVNADIVEGLGASGSRFMHVNAVGWNLNGVDRITRFCPGLVSPYERYRKNLFPDYETSVAMALAGRVFLTPIEIPHTVTVDRIVAFWGGTAAGNVRAGIYYDNGATPTGGDLIVESASVAKTGTWRKQEITIDATQLYPGLYWLAVQSDETLSTIAADSDAMIKQGTLVNKQYDRAGGYGAFTDPCPAVIGDSPPILWLRVASIP